LQCSASRCHAVCVSASAAKVMRCIQCSQVAIPFFEEFFLNFNFTHATHHDKTQYRHSVQQIHASAETGALPLETSAGVEPMTSCVSSVDVGSTSVKVACSLSPTSLNLRSPDERSSMSQSTSTAPYNQSVHSPITTQLMIHRRCTVFRRRACPQRPSQQPESNFKATTRNISSTGLSSGLLILALIGFKVIMPPTIVRSR